MSTILQAETGIQPHPVTLQSLCSDPVLCRQDRSPDPGALEGVGVAGGIASGVPVGSGAPDIQGELRHLVGAQKPREGSSHFFHGSREPGLRLRSRAAMLPWNGGSSLPHSRIHGDWGVGAGGGCFPGSTKGWG